MANEEQLNILKQGVKVWNTWREAYPEEEIDLTEANLNGIHLDYVDLHGANLYKADLFKSTLRNANLCDANLSQANLHSANCNKANFRGADLFGSNLYKTMLVETTLSDADLRETNLRQAPLIHAILHETNLSRADLSEAVLQNAVLSNANLQKANLSQANLADAIMTGANLYRANLRGAHLYKTCLRRANLSEVDLIGADIRETDLRDADLRGVRFLFTMLSQTNLTGANLFGSARDDWKIDGVVCNYIYWDDRPNFDSNEIDQVQQWDAEHRYPKDRDFRPGEFEALYKQLPTFEYIFEHGFTPIDTVLMDRVVQEINERHPEFELTLDSLQSRGQPHAKFTVVHKEHAEAAEQAVKTEYETRFAQLEGDISRLQQMLNQLADRPQYIINQLQGAIDMGDTYNIQGGQVGAVGKGAIAAGNTFQQIVTDLSRLRDYMAANADTPEQQAAAEDVAKAEQAAQKQDEATMGKYLKSAGKWALDCAKEIGTDVAAEYLKKVTLGL